ncbi:sulfate transporter 1.3-like isoform X1 [Diospyros lotus]|uniref:sulfate transporter 1.3-like n=1 Tax=Diospyros lotus TaxID=55363 RepID=UPI00225586E6|nr:sulfate transporter 1.3-like [Diospyros lotus]XP_052190757.1 sulfate transporter 1.3-like [Diospyros lotus]XP_052190759.1 sulfate transporter 1.3-like [Diospyros lotus]XP_052190760.1 sulfate transporter 1.3-like isoform X1 [Diospyros lotus]XP_052190761.1 sulfate transporter 1.3-like isoform X1 [Diospyros lotus]XP_052190762.1 sulfate transporter 1.3-like isoform X1 [Diospyros lotus]XP_052190763.1 sulfate transporter 1.3-like isoform X1 [Diospyros lotus]XP_052190764.1 sulfate transporter 1.
MAHHSDDTKEMDIRSLSSSQHQVQNFPYIHKVGLPPKQNLFNEFKTTVKETFFADDPLRHFKDQPKSRKFILGLQAIFPILRWVRNYNFSKFRGDLIAGLTIASLCIPQDIGYAKLANLEPQYGLYSSFVPPLVYSFMGSSRDIAIGPVAVVSLLLGTMLQNEIDSSENAAEYLRLAFTATFFAGITQATLGFLRLGFLIDFLSHAAVVGFMGGAAITIALQQLKGFLGIKKFTKKTDIVSVLHSVFGSANHGWNWQTIVIGSSFLAFLLFAKYIGKKNKKLFWVSAIAPLISVVLSTFFVYVTHAEKQGVQIVRHIDKGINPPSIDKIYFTGDNLLKGFRIGVVAGMIALTEAVAIGRTFASMKDYQLDGNKEMVALGVMNVVGSITSCYVTTGSFSRSAVNYMAGCQTAVSNIIMSIVVFLTLEFLTPLFKYTPNAILSSIIISAVIGLIDFEAAILIWKIDKFDFIACMGAFFGVVFASVETGLLIAVSISFAKILLQVTRPRTAILGRIPRTNVYRNIQQYPEATKVPGVLIVRVDSAIYFSNSNYIRERILRWLTDEEEQLKASCLPKIQFLIVEMSPVTDIDTSGIHALEELYRSLQKRDVQLVLANPGRAVIDKLHASSFADLIGEDKILLTVADAVVTCAPQAGEEV